MEEEEEEEEDSGRERYTQGRPSLRLAPSHHQTSLTPMTLYTNSLSSRRRRRRDKMRR